MLELIDRTGVWLVQKTLEHLFPYLEKFSAWLDGDRKVDYQSLGEFNNKFAMLDKTIAGEYLFMRWDGKWISIAPGNVKEVVDMLGNDGYSTQTFLETREGWIIGLNQQWWETLGAGATPIVLNNDTYEFYDEEE